MSLPSGMSDADTLLRLAASAELGSEHPLSRALVEAADTRRISLVKRRRSSRSPATGFKRPVDDRVLLIGNLKLMTERHVETASHQAQVAAAGRTGQDADVHRGRRADWPRSWPSPIRSSRPRRKPSGASSGRDRGGDDDRRQPPHRRGSRTAAWHRAGLRRGAAGGQGGHVRRCRPRAKGSRWSATA